MTEKPDGQKNPSVPDADPTGAFQRSIMDEGSNDAPKQGGYSDPNAPMDANKLPPHLRPFVTKKQEGEEEPALGGLPEPSRNVGPEDMIGSYEPIDTTLPSSAAEVEEESDGFVGEDPVTGEKVVTPKKPKDNIFEIHNRESKPKKEYDGSRDLKDILAHIRKETDYHPYVLPSRGLLYPKSSPLSDGKILIRPMRGPDEEILLTPTLMQDGESLEMILKRCIMFSDRTALQDPLQMLTQDGFAALIIIRGMTYGPLYDCGVNCQSCGGRFQSTINLDEDLTMYHAEDPNMHEPFETILPDSGLRVKYRLPRGSDEKIIARHADKQRKKTKGKGISDVVTVRSLLLTTEIEGQTTEAARREIINAISLNDRAHIRDKCNYPPFGVDTRVNFTCPHCGAENYTQLPMSIDFFIRARAEEM